MSDPALCYIAAPFSDPSETIRRWHVDRARLLARLALECGLAPVVVHGEIEAGTYGDDSDPEQRARGMAASAAICRGVLATPRAVLWALLRHDGTISDGTRAEVGIALRMGSEHQTATWSAWQMLAEREAPHLLPDWDRLAVRPDAAGEWVASPDGGLWTRDAADGWRAIVCGNGWAATDGANGRWKGSERGALGRAAADAALRAAGVLS